LERAARFPDLLFPIFTNGTLLKGDLLDLLSRHRNLVPLVSLEGGRDRTDQRRAPGVYDRAVAAMDRLAERSLLFGTSITVTSENLDEVTSTDFIEDLAHRGCRAVVFVEFVPVSLETRRLVLSEDQRVQLQERIRTLEERPGRLVLVAFPGDESASEGCLAAGRGFIHIGCDGAAEPCPFSPHSDLNVKDRSLSDALESPLFRRVAAQGLLNVDHRGGCALVEQDAQVAAWATTNRSE
jgi:MoaA/NifB/PqqE/SkfB family radical SAM enzyme